MPFISKSFRSLVYRVSSTGIFILAAFYLGSFAYFHALSSPQPLPVKNFTATISGITERAVTIDIEGKEFILKGSEIKNWIEPYTRSYTGQADLRFSDRLTDYLTGLAAVSGKPPTDARFVFENDKPRITAAGRDGRRLNIEQASIVLRKELMSGATKVFLKTEPVSPAITAETIDSLGITAKLGSGESNFAGSSPARIQNITVASAKYNGLILKPGQTFSFNEILGEVEASGGYAPEKIIRNHKIEYDYGGGICQVSTTLFRAAIFAGLPIIERRPHAFPVVYYSPQGFDATIYPGITDLKFFNDTGRHLLIQTKITGTKIQFEMYGTADGRTVAIDGPHILEQQPDGTLKTVFTRSIARGEGTSTEQKFFSNYNSAKEYPVERNPFE
ncbi:MAG: hypothetical protein A3C88_00545 [Candidatus Yanofskybacteria bacterium RIFCSPHIGHO2_02_FULL_50_12]|uniref:Uncharacterized protein n=1 Tax=Candidatus Yanofskybacteria bacterium RIFCSPHIGHO2_02_FULL_50_12 TaxID=1802685 RepID=A0A1F8FW44_9BACT|nr:MAG: hypothetical protein A3C88_00545 [Candidatus Yanofskybacteria bacterium RIFCSPHIGHO2_02_FULL_50_12]